MPKFVRSRVVAPGPRGAPGNMPPEEWDLWRTKVNTADTRIAGKVDRDEVPGLLAEAASAVETVAQAASVAVDTALVEENITPLSVFDPVEKAANRADSRVFDVRASGVIPNDSTKAVANSAKLADLAADIAAIGGGQIFFPTGEWWVNSALTLPSGVTVQGTGQRKSRIRTSNLASNGLEIVGSSPLGVGHKVQTAVRDIGFVGPGKASGGTGVGIRVKWASVGLDVERVWVTQWGSHGTFVEDSYSMTWSKCLFDANGGDGWHGETNINHSTWSNCISINNGAKGFVAIGGTSGKLINFDAESNAGGGVDLRYCVDYECWLHLEKNTGDNVYLGRRNAGEGCNLVTIHGSHIQGTAVTLTGIHLEYANKTVISCCEFAGHVTQDILIDATATRTLVLTNKSSGDPVITDNSASTVIFAYGSSLLMMEIAPGVRFRPRATNPPALAEGMVWAATGGLMRTRDDARIRRFITVIEGSATIDPASIPAQSTTELTITLSGAAAGDGVLLIPPATTSGLIAGQARVSAADTISIPVANVTGADIDAPSAGWKVKVYKG